MKRLRKTHLHTAFNIITIVLLMSFISVGCSQKTGKDFDTSHIPSIKKGSTTQQEILDMFGKPASKGLDDKGSFWLYSLTTGSAFQPIKVKKLKVWFDENNIVKYFNFREGEISAAELFNQ